MRRLRRSLVLLALPIAFGLVGPAGCSDYAEDVEAVKAAQAAGATNEAFVRRLAGAQGTVEWSGRRSPLYPKDSNVVLVEATVRKASASGAERTVVLQYHYNRTTQQTLLTDVLLDGKSRGILGGSLDVLLMQFE